MAEPSVCDSSMDAAAVVVARPPPRQEETLSPELVQSISLTIRNLGKHLNYPPLCSKFLKQPPFLYMHDVTTSVIKSHGLLCNLFTAEELNRFIAKRTKENRINFFQKLVSALRATTGEALLFTDWRRLSIGHIPLASNEILQCMAFALENNMNSDIAVRKLTGLGRWGREGGPTGLKRGLIDSDSEEGSESSEGQLDYKRFRQVTVYDAEGNDIDYDVWDEYDTSDEMDEEQNHGLEVADDPAIDELVAAFETQFYIS